MKKLLLLFTFIAAVALGAALFSGSLLGKAVKAGVEALGPEIVGVPVAIDGVSFSLLSGRSVMSGMTVGNPKGFKSQHSLQLGQIVVDADPLSFLSNKIVVEEISVVGPEIVYEPTLTGTNLGKILKNVESFIQALPGASETAPEEGAATSEDQGVAALRFQVDLIEITGGRVTLANSLLEGEAIVVDLPPIRITDIGQGEEGATVADVAKRVLASINQETVKAAAASGGSLKSQLKGSAGKLSRDLKTLLGGSKKEEQ